MTFGFPHNDFDTSAEQSLDGSFRKSNSVMSTRSMSDNSTSSKFNPSSRRLFKGLKDFGKKVVDLELFARTLEEWVVDNSCTDSTILEQSFRPPFLIEELCKLDLALEGVLFQQLFRMPCPPYASDDMKGKYFALEDFLHAVAEGLWRTFWHRSGPLPFFLACPRHPRSKFYTLEKAISRGRLQDLHGIALISKSGSHIQVHWDQVVEFALFKNDIMLGDDVRISTSTICEALFYGFHMLISRRLSKFNTVSNDSIFVLVLDSKFGGVVKFGGDISKLDIVSPDPYQSVANWIKHYAEVSVSPGDVIWNKLGNASWGDTGTLQLLLAMLNSIIQWHGPPKKSIVSLASDHSLRLHKRRLECRLIDTEYALVPFEQDGDQQGEIVELEQNGYTSFGKQKSRLELKRGQILLLEDQQQGQKTFRIKESLIGGNSFLYNAVSPNHPTELFTLYVGSHPSRLEPSWEDMSLWYQVQRQTKVLNILKQCGISSKYLPEINASGQLLHNGSCTKQSPGGRCDHPCCGTPILVTSPVGKPLSHIISNDGPFSSEEAVRCCRDCLSALRTAGMANVQHGDICPENIIRVLEPNDAKKASLYVPISWGHAVLEDRDSPVINLQFSSSHALEHGKLCPSSDAESLVYLLYFVCGGSMQEQDSIESALQWRERSWLKRLIQQQLGEVSALLKAFADYVDSLCGTPYPVDYDIWLKRLNRAVDGSADRGKLIEEATSTLRLEDVAESSGTSGGGNSFSC